VTQPSGVRTCTCDRSYGSYADLGIIPTGSHLPC
jgi:hypothetical protein